MKKNAKIIFADIDNTLLHCDKTISDYTVDIFTHCRERGILTKVATYRSEIASARINPDIFISRGCGDNMKFPCRLAILMTFI